MSKIPKVGARVTAANFLDAEKVIRRQNAFDIVALLYRDRTHSEWVVCFVRHMVQAGIPDSFGEVVGQAVVSTYGTKLKYRMDHIHELMAEYAGLL